MMPGYKHTQASISAWADATFGEASSDLRVAVRANEEMAELLRALTSDAPVEKIVEEAADVVIVLCRLATRLGGEIACREVNRHAGVSGYIAIAAKFMAFLVADLLTGDQRDAAELVAEIYAHLAAVASLLGHDLRSAIDAKMDINVAREWRKDGSGHGYHVRAKGRDAAIAIVERFGAPARLQDEDGAQAAKRKRLCAEIAGAIGQEVA